MAKQKARAEGPARKQDLFARPPEGYRFATPEESRFINDQGSQMLLVRAKMDTQAARMEQHSAQLELARRDAASLIGQLQRLQKDIAAYNRDKIRVEDLPGDIIEREDGSIIICVDPKKRLDAKKRPPTAPIPAPAIPEAKAPDGQAAPAAEDPKEKKGGD